MLKEIAALSGLTLVNGRIVVSISGIFLNRSTMATIVFGRLGSTSMDIIDYTKKECMFTVKSFNTNKKFLALYKKEILQNYTKIVSNILLREINCAKYFMNIILCIKKFVIA